MPDNAFITLTRHHDGAVILINVATIRSVMRIDNDHGSRLWRLGDADTAEPLLVKEEPQEIRNFLRVAGCKVIG